MLTQTSNVQDRRRKRVFVCSPWIPAEWIKAFGLNPAGPWFSSRTYDSSPAAAGTCAFANSLFQMVGLEPDDAFVFSSHCDQLRRSYDALAPNHRNRVFLFNLPATWQGDAAIKLYRSELLRLGNFLIGVGGRRPSSVELAESIAEARRSRAGLCGKAAELSPRLFLESLAGQYGNGEAGESDPLTGRALSSPEHSIPLAIVGGPILRDQWYVLEMIERLGGRIVLVASEPGERNLWIDNAPVNSLSTDEEGQAFDELAGDLARSYVANTVDVYQRPNEKLYSWLDERLRARRVRGILLWHYTWCDLWRAEAQSLKEAFKLPVLQFDADTLKGPVLTRSGRIEAFIESLK